MLVEKANMSLLAFYNFLFIRLSIVGFAPEHIVTQNIKQNQFCFTVGNILFFFVCVPTDGSLPKEPKGDVSSQIAGKHKHKSHRDSK